MKLRAIPTFYCDDGRTVVFVRLGDGFPGFTHRILIDRVSAGLLAEGFPPNAKSAKFFLERQDLKKVVA